MPYISDHDMREKLDNIVNQVDTHLSEGELNYLVTRILDRYLIYNRPRYVHINMLIGMLECVKLELYRRVASPYEDVKKEQYGEVYNSHNGIR